MAKGKTRPTDTAVDEVAEIEMKRCPARRVRIASEQSPASLRRLRRGTVRLGGEFVVIVSRGHRVAVIVSSTEEIRSCLEEGIRYEAELDTVSDEFRVQIRPVA